MAKVFFLSYDLNKSGQDYSGLIEELKKSPNWWHYLDSTWLIYTNETAEQLWNRIKSHCDQNDSVLIIEVRNGSSNRSGWLPQKAWDWINQQLG